MMQAGWIIFGLFGAGIMVFAWQRSLLMLQYFQQEEYDPRRFLAWWRDKQAYDKRATAAFLIAGLLLWLAGQQGLLPYAAAIPAPVFGAWISWQDRKKAKKPLVATQRAQRILALGLVLWLILPAGLAYAQPGLVPGAVITLLAFQAPPFILLLANGLLAPFERRVKNRYLTEAKEKLAALDPKIIAITGSYGKTSTKHILGHILSAAAPTLMTPGSVNTEMGITRIIREKLEPRHAWFIAEMGAYGPGSIARLCRLAPPDMGLITGVGVAHYERFKSLDTVFETKFELAEAVRANGGKTLVNVQGIPEELQGRLAGQDAIIRVGGTGDRKYALTSHTETPEGLSLTIEGESLDEPLALKAPVWGAHQAWNILLAVAAALELGVGAGTIRAALANLPQTRHRLEVIRQGAGPTIIDDAYNSNPAGFRAALDTLDILGGQGGGKRILITPGMAELGARHADEHRSIGRYAAAKTDIVLAVTPGRIPSFLEGLREADTPPAIHTFATQAGAENWARAHAGADDVILFENNLPDLYEVRPAL